MNRAGAIAALMTASVRNAGTYNKAKAAAALKHPFLAALYEQNYEQGIDFLEKIEEEALYQEYNFERVRLETILMEHFGDLTLTTYHGPDICEF